MSYQQHPLSAVFPSMSDEDFQSLKDSIEVNGVLNPITIFEGQVIDGWHRYRAATELAMECPEQQMEPWIDPKDFVLAQNKNRRHILVGQLSAATVAVYAWNPLGANQHKGGLIGTIEAPKTTKELAEIAGVSPDSIVKAKTVQTKAAPEVQQAVKDGKIGLEKAVAISKLPKEEQAAAISQPIKKVADFREAQEKRREETKVAELEIQLGLANDEIQTLRESLALNELPEHERLDAADLIANLKKENASLKEQLRVVESQRDQYMTTVSEMERQIKYLNKRA